MKEVSVHGRAELIEGTKVRFICPEGHTQVEDMGRKSLPISKRLGVSAVAMMVRWWSSPPGVKFVCKKCTKAHNS